MAREVRGERASASAEGQYPRGDECLSEERRGEEQRVTESKLHNSAEKTANWDVVTAGGHPLQPPLYSSQALGGI